MSPVRDPFATAVVSEARRAGVRVVSVDDDGLRSLAQGFDILFPMTGSLDDTLADSSHSWAPTARRGSGDHLTDGRCARGRDHHRHHPRGLPPWGADVFVPDLPAVWRILRAMPATRAASTRGVRLSMSSSAIGALMLIPGVPGYGPESVNAGVLGGLWAGFNAGSRVFGETLPAPEPGHEWYALPVSEVQRLLPRPPSAPHQPAAPPNPLLAPARLAGRAASATWSLAGEFLGEMRTNLADPITPILATGAVASALLGSPLDAALVGGVLLANAALSSEQQLHAERVLRRLLAVQDPLARRRVGAGEDTEDVVAGELRPGDSSRSTPARWCPPTRD